jgi:hypothetical protein
MTTDKKPDNVIRFPPRRNKPRWMERMDEKGLPAIDMTWRTTKDAA